MADQAADQAAKPLPPAAGRAWPPSSARWPVGRDPGIAPPGACLVAGYLVHLVRGSWPAGLVAAQLVHLVAGYVMSWCRGYVMSWCQVIPDLVAGYLVHLVRGPRYLVRGLQLVAVARRPGGRAGQARRARTWWPCLHPRPGGRQVFACHMQTGPQLVAVARRPPTWCTWWPPARLVRWPPAWFPGPWAASRRPGATARRPGGQDHGPRGLARK